MSGKKILSVFLEGIHQEILTWGPKPRFVFEHFWPALSTRGVEQILLEQKKEKEPEKKEDEKDKVVVEKEADVAWDRDGSVSVTYPDAIHHFKLERGMIHYTKYTSEATEEETFDTKILQEEMAILWSLKEKKKDKEMKEKNKEEDEESIIKMILSKWIEFGMKKTAEHLREVANDKQQLKKALKELSKKKDELVEKALREHQKQQKDLKRQEKLEKKEKKGKEKNTPAATVPAPDATVPAPDATAPEAAAPNATASETTEEATVPGVPVEK